jgi:hypothetical protein
MWFAWFWIGIGWKWWAQTNPDSERDENLLEPMNPFLKFFVCASLMLVIAAVQWILYLFTSVLGTSGSKQSEFTQFCSVANCSVLMLDEYL